MIMQGVRILDLSMGWAGPLATMLLADFGAEIVKVESTRHLDWWRGSVAPQSLDDRPYERAPTFNGVNRNKYGCTLDLNDPRGKALLKRLAVICDVLVENFTPRVMENLGLTYDVLRGLNPSLIMLSMPGFGSTGPWRDYAGFGNTVEALSGVTALTGYPDGAPTLCSNAYGDPIAGMGGAIALMMALLHRRKTGEGQHIELSHQELVTHHVSGALMDYQMNGRVQGRKGNRHPWMAPHGVYPCRGEDNWVAIAVSSDPEWRGLCGTLGLDAAWADARFRDTPGRWQHQEEINKILPAATAAWDKKELAERLQGAGIAAAPVLSNGEVLEDPQVQARDSFVWQDRRFAGNHPYPGVAARLSATPGTVRKAAPCLGEDNALVLGGLLGVEEDELESLVRDGVIGDRAV